MNPTITAFIIIGLVLIVCAVAVIATPLLRARAGGGGAPVAAVISAVLLPAAAILIYQFVSNHTWQESRAQRAAAAPTPTTAPALTELLGGLERRLEESPEDADGWLLLGRTYLQLNRVEEARQAFASALAIAPTTDAKLSLAEAEIMLDRASLSGEAGRLVEEALAEAPDNAKALFYGGMVAMTRGDNEAVGARWRKLLAMSPPDDLRQMLEQQLAQLGLASEPLPAATPPAESAIDVSVAINDRLADRVAGNAVLFVLARRPGVPGPPIAAVRRSAQELPVSLRMSDADVMLAGQSLLGVDEIELVARVSNGGNPVASPGDLFGQVTWRAVDGEARAVSIIIDQIVD